jgi:putative zinc finger/helix-turn-helix YgiT family protein
MSRAIIHECTSCGEQVAPERRRNYRYGESGLSNVILQGIEVADCPSCGNSDVVIPRMAKIHRAIALALAKSPARLTGEQFRFLRKHLGLSGDEFGRYLHTDRTKISKWERGQDRIGPATDRLVRLLVAALDSELRPGVSAVAEHLPEISDDSGKVWELQVDIATLQTTFSCVSRAA